MSQFMLLLYDTPAAAAAFKKFGAQEMQSAIEKYMAWAKRPFVTGSQRLGEDAGRIIRSENGKSRVTDGPFGETKEVLGGYYVIEAANYDEAVQRTMDHPHLEHGGTIEVRKTYGS